MTYLFYKKRLEAIRELLSRETDEGPVMSLAALDDPHVEQDFWELLNSPVYEPRIKYDKLCDRHWVAGAKFGWNCASEDAADRFNSAIEARLREIRTPGLRGEAAPSS